MVDSRLISIKDLVKKRYFFNVPIYQRLYVWGPVQIQTLLADIWDACKENKEFYYLGATLVIEREEKRSGGRRFFDLIDGQQRFTTLWLMSIAWKRALKDFRFDERKSDFLHRIEFPIRPQVQSFFEAEIRETEAHFEEVGVFQDALTEIKNFQNKLRQDGDIVDVDRMAKYVFEKVKLVFTEVPSNTDLNKLFEVINNRGMQLQHHEILKARLLKHINQNDRGYYGQLWDSCSYMNEYVERNLRQSTSLNIAALFDDKKSKNDDENLSFASEVVKALRSTKISHNSIELSLKSILNGGVDYSKYEEEIEESSDTQRVKSILTFSMLLQHVLRIHLAEKKRSDINKILDKDLLEIFQTYWLNDDPDEDEVKEFIEWLWEVRYRFDKHIIKWVETEDGEVHAIRRPRISKSGKGGSSVSLVRDTSDTDIEFAALQSMLYHSQQSTTHYWLTPLLSYLCYEGPKDAFFFLKYLDNHLLCAFGEDPLIMRTRLFLENYWCSDKVLDVTDVLNSGLGTEFSHYWFYKLEFILWTQMKQRKGARWQKFRFTAKNSVEHISPQNPEITDLNKVSKEVLDTFGNLALVSRSLNSEYGNMSFRRKREKFIEKNHDEVDSMKMDLIYANESWNDLNALSHRNAMIQCYAEYFRQVESEVKRFRT